MTKRDHLEELAPLLATLTFNCHRLEADLAAMIEGSRVHGMGIGPDGAPRPLAPPRKGRFAALVDAILARQAAPATA